MDGSAMVGLFSKYGLDSEIEGLRNFKTLMDSIGERNQSAWELKRFTILPDREPIRAVIVDYGFMNCRSVQEGIGLRSVYSKFFSMDRDEMALHQACVKGRQAPFLEANLGKLPFPRELLSNYYPLERCNYMGMVDRNVEY